MGDLLSSLFHKLLFGCTPRVRRARQTSLLIHLAADRPGEQFVGDFGIGRGRNLDNHHQPADRQDSPQHVYLPNACECAAPPRPTP